MPRDDLRRLSMDRSMRLRIEHFLAGRAAPVPGVSVRGCLTAGWSAFCGVDLVDGLEDQRGGAADGAADQVPGAVAVVDLGQAAAHVHLLAVGAGGHVAEGQRVGQRLRGGANSRLRRSARPRSSASMTAQEW